jgi:hypothetical protein
VRLETEDFSEGVSAKVVVRERPTSTRSSPARPLFSVPSDRARSSRKPYG